jgi:hypothetical protein
VVIHAIGHAHPGNRRLIDLEDVILFEEGQQEQCPGVAILATTRPQIRKRPARVVVVVHGQAELLEVVAARHACCRLADFLDGRQEQANEDGDDGNHHQELNQREPGRANGIARNHRQIPPRGTER